MRYMSATEAKQGFAEVLDAAQRGPVTIRRQKRMWRWSCRWPSTRSLQG